MRISQKANAADWVRLAIAGDGQFLDRDPERRFIALANESTRRRIARYGSELVRLGEDLQRMAAAPGTRPRAARRPRQLH